jgi:acyl-coenzyme A synthetase/AMP-(fatty) acid ligase
VSTDSSDRSGWLPLLESADRSRPLIWRERRAVCVGEFMGHVEALAARLPASGAMINLCRSRQAFMVAYVAALLRNHPTLMPASRAAGVIEELLQSQPDAYAVDDAFVQREAPTIGASGNSDRAKAARDPALAAFTSGTTGEPGCHLKTWGAISRCATNDAIEIRRRLAAAGHTGDAAIVATVPSQHMYGFETAVMMSLIAGMSLHDSQPLLPAEVAAALAAVPEPRVLITTPLHLRALCESGTHFPPVALLLSATAPLTREAALAAEATFGCPLLEMFGSTETCVIAARETARQTRWSAYKEVGLRPASDGTWVSAPWLTAPVRLLDIMELHGDDFELCGRHADLLEIAGKRASLSDITRRLLNLPGVHDAVVFQPEPPRDGQVARLAALVVAPGISASQLLRGLSDVVDPAFLPRPLLLVRALPRNETGKLPREQLLQTMQSALRGHPPD